MPALGVQTPQENNDKPMRWEEEEEVQVESTVRRPGGLSFREARRGLLVAVT